MIDLNFLTHLRIVIDERGEASGVDNHHLLWHIRLLLDLHDCTMASRICDSPRLHRLPHREISHGTDPGILYDIHGSLGNHCGVSSDSWCTQCFTDVCIGIAVFSHTLPRMQLAITLLGQYQWLNFMLR